MNISINLSQEQKKFLDSIKINELINLMKKKSYFSICKIRNAQKVFYFDI
jgi:hypothetical protein